LREPRRLGYYQLRYSGSGEARMRSTAIVTALILVAPFNASLAIAQSAANSAFTDREWAKTCPVSGGKRTCITGKDARRRDGTPVSSIQLFGLEDGPRGTLRLTFPLGMQLVPGTRLSFDQDLPARASYSICTTGGCSADYEVDASMIEKLKTRRQLTAQAIDKNGKPVSIRFSLKGFAKVHDGPPTFSIDASSSDAPAKSRPPRP
jgi:invasion protein IalB